MDISTIIRPALRRRHSLNSASNNYLNSDFAPIVKDIVFEYAESGTLHGVNYVGDRSCHLIERLFWVLTLSISLVVCYSLISKSYTKWQETPTITNADETATLVSEIPFPAITICADTKYKRALVDNVVDLLINASGRGYEPLSEINSAYLETLLSLCFNKDNYTQYQSRTPPKLYVQYLKELIPNDVLIKCRYLDGKYLCADMFSHSVTNEGICYTFNNLNSSEIYRDIIDDDLKYNKVLIWRSSQIRDNPTGRFNENEYPRRISGSGHQFAVSVDYRIRAKDSDRMCPTVLPGLKVLFHSPDVIPDFSRQRLRVQFQQQMTFLVTPKIIKTSKGLKALSPERRNCFYGHERYLKYFKTYNQPNCQLECLSNFTLKMCGCVSFNMPRTNNTPVCGLKDIECYKEAEVSVLLYELNENATDRCKCLTTCTMITYSLKEENFYHSQKTLQSNDRFSYFESVALDFYYAEASFVGFTKSELFTQTDFLANCGGLMGLFVGFSILSLVELFYYFTLRLTCNYRKKRKEHLRMVPEINVKIVNPYYY